MSDFESKLLGAEHDTSSFRCGKPDLDRWLQREALRAQSQDNARTTVWTPVGSDRVVAYYSLKPTEALREHLTSGQAGGNSRVSAFLISSLALDQMLRRQGLGKELLHDALDACVSASDLGGGRLIIVDAIDDEAEAFYAANDFLPTRIGRRLVMKMATARSALR